MSGEIKTQKVQTDYGVHRTDSPTRNYLASYKRIKLKQIKTQWPLKKCVEREINMANKVRTHAHTYTDAHIYIHLYTLKHTGRWYLSDA